MLEKYSFMPGGEMLVRPPAEAARFDVAVALDTAVQNRLGLGARRRARGYVDQHRSSPDEPALRRSRLHRPDRARDRARFCSSFSRDRQLPIESRDRGEPLRRDLHRHRLVPISEHHRAHVRDRRRAAEVRRERRTRQPAALRELSAPPDGVAARAARHDALRGRRTRGELQSQPRDARAGSALCRRTTKG